MKVAPSIIAADFSELQNEIRRVEKAGADLLHLDVMDGVFVPNITFGPMIVEAIDKITDLPLDAHLMIVKPENYLRQFIDVGADWISFHLEATEHIGMCLDFIKDRNKEAGLVINPETPFQNTTKYLDKLDFLLIMSVHPGFYGQKFIPEVLKKIEEAKDWIVKHRLSCLIEVDGGIYVENAKAVAQAGVDIAVSGAGIFKTENYKKAIEGLRCSRV